MQCIASLVILRNTRYYQLSPPPHHPPHPEIPLPKLPELPPQLPRSESKSESLLEETGLWSLESTQEAKPVIIFIADKSQSPAPHCCIVCCIRSSICFASLF